MLSNSASRPGGDQWGGELYRGCALSPSTRESDGSAYFEKNLWLSNAIAILWYDLNQVWSFNDVEPTDSCDQTLFFVSMVDSWAVWGLARQRHFPCSSRHKFDTMLHLRLRISQK